MAEPIRVLHVDDEPDFAELAGTFLEREADQFTVETVEHADDALDRLGSDGPRVDCVVSDYDMPGTDGIELLEAVREREPDLPFILFTGQGSEAVASEAIAAGVTDYLQKGSGTEQYELLANRIENAVDQYRASQRAAALERIHDLVSDINQTLIRATSRAEIETDICEILSESDPYLYAWIGRVDPESARIEPRALAGVPDEYLENVTITADEGPTGQGPAGTALRERRIAVSQNVVADPGFEPWREAVAEVGVRSVAAVPLVYEERTYGVLAVGSDRPHAFDERERSLLSDLGDDVGHAIHAVDLRTDLQRYETIVEALGDPVYALDEQGRYTFVNEAFVERTGYTEAEIVGEHVSRILPEAEIERGEAVIRELLRDETATTATFEVERTTADGERILAENNMALLPTDDGSFAGTAGVLRDITERKERERTARRYQDMVNAMGEAACIYDKQGRFDVVNESLAAFYGTTPEALEGQESNLIPQLRASHEGDPYAELLAGEREEIRGEIDGEFPGHGRAVLDYRLTRLVIDGEIDGVVGVAREITERKEREEALRRYERIMENLPVGVFRTTPDGDIVDVNEALVELYGADSKAALLDRGVEDLYANPAERSRVLEEIERTGSVDAEVVEARTVDGETIRIELTMRRIEDGDEVYYDGILRDITERKQYERELERQNQRLEAFTSVVAHDLRNPLSVARGRLELARAADDSDHLAQVADAHERMAQLIDDLLTLAREGDDVSDVESVDLADAVADCWETVDTADATLRTDVDRTLRADPSRLRELLENLVRNAIEHGGEDVTVTVGDFADGFYVADDGPGVPAEKREQIFENGYTTSETGTGFGLAIVEEIATAHGWEMRVTDSGAGGVRFEIVGVEFVDPAAA